MLAILGIGLWVYSKELEKESNMIEEDKWLWMMGWCKKNNYPPGEWVFWNLAERAYYEHKKKQVIMPDLDRC